MSFVIDFPELSNLQQFGLRLLNLLYAFLHSVAGLDDILWQPSTSRTFNVSGCFRVWWSHAVEMWSTIWKSACQCYIYHHQFAGVECRVLTCLQPAGGVRPWLVEWIGMIWPVHWRPASHRSCPWPVGLRSTREATCSAFSSHELWCKVATAESTPMQLDEPWIVVSQCDTRPRICVYVHLDM